MPMVYPRKFGAAPEKLYLSVHTVATHRKNISSKLEIHSTAGLAIFAILHHLVDIKDLNPHAK